MHGAFEIARRREILGGAQQHGGVTSWPQACMRAVLRTVVEVLSSSIGSASMSARRPMARGLLPTRTVPTTPVLPTPS